MKKYNAPEHPLLAQMRERITRFSMYRDGERTLVALSGGADSVCLLHALRILLGQERLVAVHVNHLLRGAESDRDEAFCRTLCESLDIPLVVRTVDVAALCREHGIEKAARDVRYAIFAEEASRFDCATISLAHNTGDNLETILFHLCRGAGVAGLAGIPAKRPLGALTVVRPLLDASRDEILSYLNTQGLPFVTDSTNEDTRYTRNYIRHKIIPLLQNVNEAASKNITATAEALADVADFLEITVDSVLTRDAVSAPRETLLALHPAPRFVALRRMIQNAGGEMLDTPHAVALTAFLQNGQNGKRIMLPYGLQARLQKNVLIVESITEFDKRSQKKIFHIPLVSGRNDLPGGVLFVGDAPRKDNSTAFYATARVSPAALPSLSARSAEAGDSYRYFGMTRSLKKLLCGIEPSYKAAFPVICDKDGILWLPGYPAADGKRDQDGILLTYLIIEPGASSHHF